MTMDLAIYRNIGKDTQVSVKLDNKPIEQFYSFGEYRDDLTIWTDEQIQNHIKSDLISRGYEIT